MKFHILFLKKKALGFNAKQLIGINLFSLILVFCSFLLYLGITYLDLNKRYSFNEIIIEQSSEIKDAKGKTLDYIFKNENRIWRNYNQLNKRLIDFVVTAEDDSFYQHQGIDLKEIKNSIKANFKCSGFKRGASTITQQLVKNLFLNKEKTIIRKLKELSLSLKVEKFFTKKRILELYMNVIEWGPGIFGAEAASRYYFDKSNMELDFNEMSFLTLIIPNPKRFSPFYKEKTINFINQKNKIFANRLYNEKHISFEEKVKVLAPFLFYKNRNPKNLESQYPKLDHTNYKGKNHLYKSLESYLSNKYVNLYDTAYEIKLSLNKDRQNEIINYLKSIDLYTTENNLYLPIEDSEGKIISIIPIEEEETVLAINSILNENEIVKEPVSKIPWNKIVVSVQILKTTTLN